jgi:hypothetical protein
VRKSQRRGSGSRARRSRSEFVPLPELCHGAVHLGSGVWAIYWDTPEGPRIAFSPAGVLDVTGMAASSARARWADYAVDRVKFLPFGKEQWVLRVAEPQADGSLAWHAFLDGECEKPTPLGPDSYPSQEGLALALAEVQERARADEHRVVAAREAYEKKIAEMIARGEIEVQRWEPPKEVEPAPPPGPVYTDCGRCDGRGFLVSTREHTIRYSPTITYRNGLRITERSSTTYTQPHYDGICGHCRGTGTVVRR